VSDPAPSDAISLDIQPDAAPPPSGVACELARQVTEHAVAAGFEPSRVVADVEGGIAVYWFGTETLAGGSHRKVASITIGNDGELAGLTEDRTAEAREGFGVALETVDAALTRLRAFVGEGLTVGTSDAPPPDLQPDAARIQHLEQLILAMDGAHEAHETAPTEATAAACATTAGPCRWATIARDLCSACAAGGEPS